MYGESKPAMTVTPSPSLVMPLQAQQARSPPMAPLPFLLSPLLLQSRIASTSQKYLPNLLPTSNELARHGFDWAAMELDLHATQTTEDALTQIEDELDLLRKENQLLERFLRRVQPEVLHQVVARGRPVED